MKLTQLQVDAYRVDYEKLLKENEVIPTNIDNLGIVMRYLRTVNWGMWELPKMSIAYSANQYDCDGVIAVTLTLDKPISDHEQGIENEKAFVCGAPRGHLPKYIKIR
ncbi:hypothetical protein SDC9_20202 [bioreactor metagenome]|uniref:Uncharacterized protein n=1 Tax=bioreactor metagenome TaxID=1076179 RepID=A0A644U632_9ZZZZ